MGAHAEPPELLFVDGTWAQAKRLMSWWPALSSLPRVVVNTAGAGSLYGTLRREPLPGCLSTLEAVALCLQVTKRIFGQIHDYMHFFMVCR